MRTCSASNSIQRIKMAERPNRWRNFGHFRGAIRPFAGDALKTYKTMGSLREIQPLSGHSACDIRNDLIDVLSTRKNAEMTSAVLFSPHAKWTDRYVRHNTEKQYSIVYKGPNYPEYYLYFLTIVLCTS
jgi:hypothetical protein